MALTLQGLDEDVNSLVPVLIPASGEEVHGVVEVKVIMAIERVSKGDISGSVLAERNKKRRRRRKRTRRSDP